MIKKIVEDSSSIWTQGTGQHPEVVLSSRIRLARNLAQFPFPIQQTETSSNGVLERVSQAITKDKSLRFYRLDEIPELQRMVLMEKHLISPEHVQNPANKGLVVNKDGSISIMVNEEDHLRIQCFESGLELESLWEWANSLDDQLEESLDYAFDEKYGYLTCCPTNLGTGMRVSVMMHLPALVLTKQAERILSQLSKVGIAVRGIFGEGTETLGNLYQLSNQLTLGQSEKDILLNINEMSKKLVDQELAARKYLLENAGLKIEDKAKRALGILTNAKIISSREALSLISDLRLGQTLNLIDNIDLKLINELFLLCQ
ncbi:MAG: protein arginine kinase, partial [Clostridia bacterium]|nr:protein arginine kinase [Clostridia bacterium]